MTETDRFAFDQNFALRRQFAGSEQALQQFSSASAHQTGNSQNLALMQFQIHILQPPAARMSGPGKRQILRFQDDGSIPLGRMFLLLGSISRPNHQMRNRARCRFGAIYGLHKLSVAKDSDAISQPKHFFHFV